MRAVFVSPHPDDFILSAGATLVKHIEKKDMITIVIVSECEHLERNKGIRRETDSLIDKILPDDCYRLDVENKRLWYPDDREAVRACLEEIRDTSDLGQTLVYCPWEFDVHQDHKAVSEEVIRTFRYGNVLQWYHPHSCQAFPADYYVSLDCNQVWRKVGLMNTFKTQYGLSYTSDHYIHDGCREAGREVNLPYAEKYKVRRLIK